MGWPPIVCWSRPSKDDRGKPDGPSHRAREDAVPAYVVAHDETLALIAEWRNQRAIARMNFAAPSMDFVRGAIARLYALRNPFNTREFRIALTGFWMGCANASAYRASATGVE